MKKYVRSLGGKIVNYLLCTVLITFCIGAVYLVFNMVNEDFYTSTVEEVFEDLSQYDYVETMDKSSNYRSITDVDCTDVFLFRIITTCYSLRYSIYLLFIASALAALFFFVMLMQGVGRHNDPIDTSQSIITKVPFDLVLTAAFTAVAILLILIFQELPSTSLRTVSYFLCIIAAFCGGIFVSVAIVLAVCMDLAACIKANTLIKGSIIYNLGVLLFKLLKIVFKALKSFVGYCSSVISNFSVFWKGIIIAIVNSLIIFVMIFLSLEADLPEISLVLWILHSIGTIALILFVIQKAKKLFDAGVAISSGDLTYKTDLKGLHGLMLSHGEHLNNISLAMSYAVNERLKSERMKTELITNVSHDLKTPLTSIINYAGLIAAEHNENEKISEYSEVLIRQSERLKRLIEDLVEVSKASTGNLDVNLSRCDAGIFIEQAVGEYGEKLNKSQLTLIASKPETPVYIMADGRRMWRIFDNLMNNICKYAQPGTRVYLSLEEKDNNAVISFRNTSREQLNITADELIERFVRGDKSRSTEGSGLGLSIAKSMTELQNGLFNLSIDGDLFKTILTYKKTED